MVVSSSTLVNVAEDAELRLVSLLAEAASPSFQKDCEKCISEGNAGELMATVVKDSGAISALLAIDPTEEAVGAFSLLAALLGRAEQESSLSAALADAVINAQTNDKEAFAVTERKITLLSVLYNMRTDGTERCTLLGRMMRLAGEYPDLFLAADQPLGMLLIEEPTGLLVAPPRLRMVTMLDSWEVSIADRRDIYRTMASIMPDGDERKQRFLLLLTESYNGDSVDEQGLSAAKDAAVGVIRDPVSLFVHQRNILSLPAIQALGNDKSTSPLLGLLRVFQEGKLSDYQEFMKKNGGEKQLLSPLGLDEKACERHMRILSLCSLASEHEEIPYAVIAETLQLPSDDGVETWVIAAVSSGLLQAKMDQLAQKVMVERSVVRQFDTDQWKTIQSRLHVWKQNVGSILTALKQSQAGTVPKAS